jgi:glycosyltransferase involved in cell wall biosynthesis
MEGVSVIVCCHNGAARLPMTLAHLNVQKPPRAAWEVIVVDNASTDGTAQVARSCWQNGPAPLRVVEEPCLGVRYARERGLAEAKYSFLGFVDDDNWVANDWVHTAHDIMSTEATIGALGSIRMPACEASPPAWFGAMHSTYAILTDSEFERIIEPLPYLPTAGLCVRKAAWEELIRNGFRLHLTGRLGKQLLGGEDTELTMSLRLSGWKLRVDPRLRLQHFMPNHRLTWEYARRLLRDHSASLVLLEAYSQHNASRPPGFRRWLSERWWYQLTVSLQRILNRPKSVATALFTKGEGRQDIIEIEQEFGRAVGLLRHTTKYGDLRREVRDAFRRRSQSYVSASN